MYDDGADLFVVAPTGGAPQNIFLARLFPGHTAACRASAIAPAAPGFVPTVALAPASR